MNKLPILKIRKNRKIINNNKLKKLYLSKIEPLIQMKFLHK